MLGFLSMLITTIPICYLYFKPFQEVWVGGSIMWCINLNNVDHGSKNKKKRRPQMMNEHEGPHIKSDIKSCSDFAACGMQWIFRQIGNVKPKLRT